MKFYGLFALLVFLVAEVRCVQRITLDDDAHALCKKYKLMCKHNKICAVQHFDWPNNITIPVCIPLSFVPVRNMLCKLPPDTGRCHARYIRWYYNIHSQECNHFQYGGCEGNQNNFMSKSECERTCIATPSIKLYEGGGNSALVQPSILTAPIYEPPNKNEYEALNSVMEPAADDYDRYSLTRHRGHRNKSDDAAKRTRRRLDKEREKEKRRERRKKEKRRMRKLQKKELKKLRCKKRREKGKKCKSDKKSKKDKKKNNVEKEKIENEIAEDKTETATEDENDEEEKETKNLINNEIDTPNEEDEKREKESKRERRRRKRKLKEKRRLEQERKRRTLNTRHTKRHSELNKKADSYSSKLFSILDQGRYYKEKQNSLIHTLS